jgi:hypothetical protein
MRRNRLTRKVFRKLRFEAKEKRIERNLLEL